MHFIALLAAAAAVTASPVEKVQKRAVLALSHNINVSNVKNIVAKGQSRLAAVNAASVQVGAESDATDATATTSSGTVTNDDVSYVAAVTIGGNSWSLIVDTGCESDT